MKVLGVVSPKAGRTLLYKITDVAKMYPHWKMIIPEFIEELCAGKVSDQMFTIFDNRYPISLFSTGS